MGDNCRLCDGGSALRRARWKCMFWGRSVMSPRSGALWPRRRKSAATAALVEPPVQLPAPVTIDRVADTLDFLGVRYLSDGIGLVALWERHSVMFAMECDGQILVMRARPHATVPLDWADRSYRVVNEWNL